MTAQRDATRPFRNCDAQELFDEGHKAFRRQDRSILQAVIFELDEFRTSREAERVSEELHELLNQLAPGSGRRRAGAGYCHECSRQLEQSSGFYCEGCMSKLWPRIERDVGKIRDWAASGVYVGRSAYPERRLLQHLQKDGRGSLSILHWASSLEEAETFETEIHRLVIDISGQHQPRAGGRFSRCHHAIYLSWSASYALPATQLVHHAVVKDLMGARQWPAPPSRFEAVHLSAQMSPDEAKRSLAALDEREQEYLDDSRGRR